MKKSIRRRLQKHQRRIEKRLRRQRRKEAKQPRYAQPVLDTKTLQYDLSERTCGIACGGIPMIHRLTQQVGLVEAINQRLHLLKLYLPYRESDHVLNLAFNTLSGGTCLEDLELLRQNETYLDALGTETIPDPTTAGDFCRRFGPSDLIDLQDAIDEARLNVWSRQPPEFFQEALIDLDGTLVTTTGECKEGMDMNGTAEPGMDIKRDRHGEELILFRHHANFLLPCGRSLAIHSGTVLG